MRFSLWRVLAWLRTTDWTTQAIAFLPAFLWFGFLLTAQLLGEEAGYVLQALSAISAIAITFVVAKIVKMRRGRSGIYVSKDYMHREGFSNSNPPTN